MLTFTRGNEEIRFQVNIHYHCLTELHIVLQVIHYENLVSSLFNVVDVGAFEEWFASAHSTAISFEPNSFVLCDKRTCYSVLRYNAQGQAYLLERGVTRCRPGNWTVSFLLLAIIENDRSLWPVHNADLVIENVRNWTAHCSSGGKLY